MYRKSFNTYDLKLKTINTSKWQDQADFWDIIKELDLFKRKAFMTLEFQRRQKGIVRNNLLNEKNRNGQQS